MESLHSWTEVLREHIHSLKLPPKELNEMEERSKFSLKRILYKLNQSRLKKYVIEMILFLVWSAYLLLQV